MLARRSRAALVVIAMLLGAVSGVQAAAPSGNASGAIGRTPPRLSYVAGVVSFWRPGAQDWTPAEINTPLAPGDELYTGHDGNLELQVGTRAFVRTRGDTQLGLANHEPDFVQIKVTTGHVSLDLRTVEPGRTVALDTPHAAFTIERPGYYRADVTEERTSFVTRRAGSATMTPAGGQPVAVTPSEEVVVEGAPTPVVQSYVAPELDVWDRWNYARTDDLLDAVSARYVPGGVYGIDDLDHHGSWRIVPAYGAIWVPDAVTVGWAPYTTGRWIWDPFYGWTWIDTAPWGWAPLHHGRWVFIDGFWAWAPGPLVARPVYAPALVAFFSAPGIRIGVGVGTPFVSWVALGWGEPLVPWWGGPAFIGRLWWAGWGGPRVVNNVVINRTTVVNAKNITVYRNVSVQHAVVAVHEEHFGRSAVHDTRATQVDVRQLRPVRGALRVKPEPASFMAAPGGAVRPPERAIARSVVSTRPPAPHAAPPRRGEPQSRVVDVPRARIVPAPRQGPSAPVQSRPPFGSSSIERPRPPVPPAHPTRPLATAPETATRPDITPRERPRAAEPPAPPSRPTAPRPEPRMEQARPPAHSLPGEPANRLFPGRGQRGRSEAGPATGTHGAPRPARPHEAERR